MVKSSNHDSVVIFGIPHSKRSVNVLHASPYLRGTLTYLINRHNYQRNFNADGTLVKSSNHDFTVILEIPYPIISTSIAHRSYISQLLAAVSMFIKFEVKDIES